MHRSRLCAIGIDCPSEVRRETEQFWAAALGGTVQSDGDSEYTSVADVAGREVFVQEIGGAARVHLDIETDDVAAEVSRLEGLGAERLSKVRTWWIMKDPAGLVFCVVPPQSDDFPGGATVWDGEQRRGPAAGTH